MMKKHNATRDTFALSLGGVTTVTSFCAMPAIANNRLRANPAKVASKRRQPVWRFWMLKRSRVV